MRAKSLTVGLSLAAAGVVTPLAALAQAPAAPAPAAPAPAAPAPAAPAPGAPAPAAPAPAAPAPAAAPTEPAAAAPAPAAPAAEAPPATAPAEAPPAAAAPAATEAPEAAPPPLAVVTGYVDGAYHANFDKYSYDAPVGLRSYDSIGGNSFLLHAAHVGVAHSFGPEASAFISLDFGSDARFNNFNYAPPSGIAFNPGDGTPANPPSATAVQTFPSSLPVDVREAYGQWTPGDFLLKAGKFVTLNGIEVVDGPLNPTITRGFLFSLAEPVTHTGVKAQYTIGGMAHIGAGIVNGWDNIVDNNNKKTILFNADVAPSPMFRAQISGSYGAEGPNVDDNPRTTVDLTGAVTLDSLVLNFQGLFGAEGKSGFPDVNGPQDNSWWGATIQPVYTMDMFSIGGRLEYFADKHGSRTFASAVDDVKVFNFTITPGITPVKNFTIRAEYRIDAILGAKVADPTTNTMIDAKEQLNGKSSQNTIAIGAHYIF